MSVPFVIIGSASLKTLDVSGNAIRDDGMSLISNELLDNSILAKLRVAECELSTKGIVAGCALGHFIANLGFQELYDFY